MASRAGMPRGNVGRCMRSMWMGRADRPVAWEARRRRSANWRSLAAMAASGILLTRPMRSDRRGPCQSGAVNLRGLATGLVSRRTVMGLDAGLRVKQRAHTQRRLQSLVKIRQNVGNMLYAHAEANGFGQNPGLDLFGGRHLAMGGGGGMAGQRFGIANIDEALDQLEIVKEFLARFHVAGNAKGQQRGG